MVAVRLYLVVLGMLWCLSSSVLSSAETAALSPTVASSTVLEPRVVRVTRQTRAVPAAAVPLPQQLQIGGMLPSRSPEVLS